MSGTSLSRRHGLTRSRRLRQRLIRITGGVARVSSNKIHRCSEAFRVVRDDANVLQPDRLFRRGWLVTPSVNLEGDVAFSVLLIDQVARRHAIDPDFDRRSEALDTEMRPLVQLEGAPRPGVVFEIEHPCPSRTEVVKDATGPSTFGVVNFHLVAMKSYLRVSERINTPQQDAAVKTGIIHQV